MQNKANSTLACTLCRNFIHVSLFSLVTTDLTTSSSLGTGVFIVAENTSKSSVPNTWPPFLICVFLCGSSERSWRRAARASQLGFSHLRPWTWHDVVIGRYWRCLSLCLCSVSGTSYSPQENSHNHSSLHSSNSHSNPSKTSDTVSAASVFSRTKCFQWNSLNCFLAVAAVLSFHSFDVWGFVFCSWCKEKP